MRAWAVTARLAAGAAAAGGPDAATMPEHAALGQFGVLTARWLHAEAVPPFVGPLRPRLPDAGAVRQHAEQAHAVALALVGDGGKRLEALWEAGEPPWRVWTILGKVWPAATLV